MHSPTLLVALFAATALATWPYVVSHSYADCTDKAADDKARVVSDECVPFNPIYDAVWFNFGTMLNQVDTISVFTDANCETPAGPDIHSSMADGTPAQCISQTQHGRKWGSVRKTLPKENAF